MLIFAEGGKTGESGEKTLVPEGREEHIKRTQFTYDPTPELELEPRTTAVKGLLLQCKYKYDL